jgi:protocatechuate 3,4-dioxygenase beta subunit
MSNSEDTFETMRRDLRVAKLSRRAAISMLAAAGGAALTAACSGDTPSSPSSAATTNAAASGGTGNATCAVSPSETVGPYPSLSDFFRSDIREDRPGLPLTLGITVVTAANGCTPVAGANVEIWQCDVDGNYSQYSSSSSRTFLRGIQTTDTAGAVTFTTIYPGWYQGRATHIHVEVTVNGRSAKVTQIAFPEDVTAEVYRSGVYAAKGQNPTTNARDNVFSDGVSQEMISLSGSATSGYTATFRVGI